MTTKAITIHGHEGHYSEDTDNFACACGAEWSGKGGSPENMKARTRCHWHDVHYLAPLDEAAERAILEYVIGHRRDIEADINDFGDLRPVLKLVNGPA